MLTDKKLANLKPGTHSDAGGLYIRVRKTGRRTWVRRSQSGGNDVWLTIGTYPQMSLAQARRTSTLDCVDLSTALTQYKSKLKVRRPEQVAGLLKPLQELKLTATRAELVKLLQDKAITAPTHANRMLTRWKDFFNFCEQNGWIDHNPLAIVQRKYIGGKESRRSCTLDWTEIASLQWGTPTQFALLFILLTGLRPSEALWVLRTKRTERIPTKENPQGTHWIPRTRLIRWALRQKLKVPASNDTLSNYLRRRGSTFTPHDLRRTFATRLADLKVAPHVIEKMLDHKMQGMMAIYNHAEYRDERIAAQRVWERKLLSLRKKAPG